MKGPRGWSQPTEADLQAKAEAATAERQRLALYAAAFGSGAGRQVLADLHRRYVDMPLGDEASLSALASANARRQLVRELERLTAAGLEAEKTKGT